MQESLFGAIPRDVPLVKIVLESNDFFKEVSSFKSYKEILDEVTSFNLSIRI